MASPPASIDRVSVGPATLGECPVWSTLEHVLYWADIDGREIHRYEPGTESTETRALAGRPGSFVLTPERGRLVVAMEHQLVNLDWKSGQSTAILDLEDAGTGNRLNDGRCDPAGRYVVGSMYEDTSVGQQTGVLHRVSRGGATETLRTGIGVSNGLAFDVDRRRMYFADSPTERVVVWHFDVESGLITNEQTFLDYANLPGKPDGACVDADGCYWSAAVHGSAVIRVTPDGVVDRRIELPVEDPTMPAFGGPALGTLYVTSIGNPGGTPDASEPGDGLDGCLLAIDAGVSGLPEPVFTAD